MAWLGERARLTHCGVTGGHAGITGATIRAERKHWRSSDSSLPGIHHAWRRCHVASTCREHGINMETGGLHLSLWGNHRAKKMVQFIQSIKSLRQHRNLNTYICSYYKDQCEYFLKASSVFIRAPKSWDYLYLEMIKMIPEILPCDVFLNKKILNLISIWHITLVSASASMVHCMFQPTFQIRYCNFRLAFCARGSCKWPMNIFPSSTKALYWVTIFAPAYWPARLSHSTLLVYILYILEFIRSQIHIHRSSYVRLTQAYPLQPVSKYGWVARNCSQVLTMSSWLTSLPNDIFPISDGTSGYEGCLCWCWGRKSHVFYSF